MNAWLLSIVGVVAIGVLLEILLEEGQTTKYIKGVFSLAVVFVIVAPLPKLLDKNFDFDSVFSKQIVAQSEFNSSFSERRNQLREQKLLEKLKDEQVPVNKVKIFYLRTEYDKIDIVKIYCVNSFDEDKIKQIACEQLNCSNDIVKVYF